MLKSHEKKMPKLFSDVVKFRRNLNFEKMDTASYRCKNDGVDEEYLRSTSNKILLRQC